MFHVTYYMAITLIKMIYFLLQVQGFPEKCIHTLKDYYMELKPQMYKIISYPRQCTSQTVHKRNGKRLELFQ